MPNLLQNLDKLTIFVVVAEQKKINQAAVLLHLTQPSISRSIQKLEESFGSKLFIRSREGVKLTKAGELLYIESSKFLKSLDDIRIRSKNINQDLTGHLTVGTYESLAEYLWPEFLVNLQKDYPALRLSVRTNICHNNLADLISGKIDLLVDAEPQIKASVISWPVYSDTFGFYISPNLDLLECNIEQAKALNITYVRGAKDENGLALEDHLKKQGYEFAREYCFDSFATAKNMAIKSLGIAILPKRLAEDEVKRKQIKPISLLGFKKDGFGRHTIYATTSSENEKDPRIKKIIAILKNHFK
jgi:DNA-binding transcriptional LysR family regulator